MSNSPAPKSKTVTRQSPEPTSSLRDELCLVVEVFSTRIYKLYVPVSVEHTTRIQGSIDKLTRIAGGHTVTSAYGAWIDAEDQTAHEPVTCYEFVVTRYREDFHDAMIHALKGLLECGESCGMCTMQDDKNIHCITVS